MTDQPSRMRALTFAGAATPPAAQPDQHTLELLEQLGQQVDQLRHALRVATDEYQASEPLVFGGTAGNYALPSEWTTPCQYTIIAVTFTGAGQAILSSDSGARAPGLTATVSPSARQTGAIFAASGVSSVPLVTPWADLPARAQLYLDVSAATNSCFVTVQFRRRVNRSGVYSEGHA